MKKMFEIFPALFVVTPFKIMEPAMMACSKNKKKRINYDYNDSLFNGRLQLYKGDCQVNADGTIVSICLRSKGLARSFNPVLNKVIYSSLQPVVFTGKNYMLTYLPVNN